MRGSDRERAQIDQQQVQERRNRVRSGTGWGDSELLEMGQDEAGLLTGNQKCEVRGGKSPTWTKLKQYEYDRPYHPTQPQKSKINLALLQ